jgi:hypothetical protein
LRRAAEWFYESGRSLCRCRRIQINLVSVAAKKASKDHSNAEPNGKQNSRLLNLKQKSPGKRPTQSRLKNGKSG